MRTTLNIDAHLITSTALTNDAKMPLNQARKNLNTLNSYKLLIPECQNCGHRQGEFIEGVWFHNIIVDIVFKCGGPVFRLV